MRLIDADNLKIGISEKTKTDSEASRFIDIINRQPTAFDLESVIEQIKEEERRLLVEMELFGKTQGVSLELVFIKYNQALVELVKVREILKSAANATNGKNGG